MPTGYSLDVALNIYKQLSRPTVTVLGALINTCRKAKQPQYSTFVWKETCDHKLPMTEMLFGSLIAAALESNDIELTKQLRSKLREVKMEQPEKKYTQLIKHLGQHKEIDAAFEVFWTLCEFQVPSVYAITALMTVCLNCNQPSRVVKLWNELKDEVTPDHIIYTLLSRANNKVADPLLSSFLFSEIKWGRFKANDFDYAQLVGAFNTQHQFKKSFEVLEYMISKNITPNTHCYTLLLAACSHTAAYATGKRLHSQLLKDNDMSIILQNTIIDMYGKIGRLSDAVATFHNSTQKDIITWTALIGALADHGIYLEIINILRLWGKSTRRISHFVCTRNGS